MSPGPIRALPRAFVPGATTDVDFALPEAELDKLRKVLRLSTGDEIAILPGDGSLIRCSLQGRFARPIEVVRPDTESRIKLVVAQALPKGDKLDEIVRACTEIGAAGFVLFPADRSVVRWDQKKAGDRLRRLEAIAREAAEVSFRTKLPTIDFAPSLSDVLRAHPTAQVLSEVEGISKPLQRRDSTIVVGPEGGWSAAELKVIGDKGVTMGPRVLRVDHAAPAAAAMILLAQ